MSQSVKPRNVRTQPDLTRTPTILDPTQQDTVKNYPQTTADTPDYTQWFADIEEMPPPPTETLPAINRVQQKIGAS